MHNLSHSDGPITSSRNAVKLVAAAAARLSSSSDSMAATTSGSGKLEVEAVEWLQR